MTGAPILGLTLAAVCGCAAPSPVSSAGPAACEAPPTASAAEPAPAGPLTVAQAIQLALARNPRLAALERELEAARGREGQAGLAPNPTLFAETEDGPLYRGTGRSKVVGGVAQAIPLGGRLAAARVQAARTREAAEARLAEARLRLVAEVRLGCARVLAGRGRLALADERVGQARRSQEIAAARVRAGDAARAEQLQAELEGERTLLERLTLESELQGARGALAVLLGLADGPWPELAGSLAEDAEALDLAEAREGALRVSPRLRALALALEAARADVALARAEAVSDLGISLGLGSSPEARRDGETPLVELGLSLPLPIFGRRQGRIAAARAEVGRAARDLDAGRGELILELHEAHRRRELARERLRRGRSEILPRAEQALEQARVGYEAGKLRFTDVLVAQRSLGEARSLCLEAQFELELARAEGERLVGE